MTGQKRVAAGESGGDVGTSPPGFNMISNDSSTAGWWASRGCNTGIPGDCGGQWAACDTHRPLHGPLQEDPVGSRSNRLTDVIADTRLQLAATPGAIVAHYSTMKVTRMKSDIARNPDEI